MVTPGRSAARVVGRNDVAVLVVTGTPDLGATLARYTAGGQTAGDVWYGSAEEARSCAARDYGTALTAWHPVPPDVEDVVAFVRVEPAHE